MKKLITVVGPTSSGKSELAVKIAKLIDGEIISADSRQIYTGLNLGTGKVDGKWRKVKGISTYIYKGVPHQAIDVIDPKKQVTVAQFQRLANKVIKDIHSRGKIPILCGGTAHWIDAVVYDQKFPAVKPNLKLRQELERKSTAQLFTMLRKLDPVRANNIDPKNPRRLIRALEIIMTTGKTVPQLEQTSKYDALWLGITIPQDKLFRKIERRLSQRLKQGLIKEVARLHKQGLSWKRLEAFGLEYKYVSLFLQDKLSKAEMVTQLNYAIKHYAKRQMTWWKRNKDIHWINTFADSRRLIKNKVSDR